MTLLGSIRGKLLALVLAAVVPFLALIGAGLWGQWQDTQAAARQHALNDARVLAAQVDDHIGNLEHLMLGLSRAVSFGGHRRQRCAVAPSKKGDAGFHLRDLSVRSGRQQYRRLVEPEYTE